MNELGFTIWLTGLPSSGKTTIARQLVNEIHSTGRRIEFLDGDEIRKTFSKGVGFTREERDLHLERVAYICELLNKHGVIVVASFVSPYADTRQKIRAIVPIFLEAFVDCPLEVCISRDVKGLYAKAMKGEIPDFTGISAPYEKPENPEILIQSDRETVQESVIKIMRTLEEKGHLTKTQAESERSKKFELFARLRRLCKESKIFRKCRGSKIS